MLHRLLAVIANNCVQRSCCEEAAWQTEEEPDAEVGCEHDHAATNYEARDGASKSGSDYLTEEKG